MSWNNAEEAARTILLSLSKGGLGTFAAVAHLGNQSLLDALSTVADDMDDENTPVSREVSKHIKHLLEGLLILRTYRNFYVHSLRSIGESEDTGKMTGWLYAVEAKGRYAYVVQHLTTEELMRFHNWAHNLEIYAREISNRVSPGNALLPSLPKKPLDSIRKPEWPNRLQKSRRYLKER